MGDLLGSLVRESKKADNILSLGIGHYIAHGSIRMGDLRGSLIQESKKGNNICVVKCGSLHIAPTIIIFLLLLLLLLLFLLSPPRVAFTFGLKREKKKCT